MSWWPLYGLQKKLSEKAISPSPVELLSPPARLFSHSLFIYVLDVGSSNALNFEISALESPQYNIHRYGIYFTASPRHSDVLLLLGRPTQRMLAPLEETIRQLPHPFCIVSIDDWPGDTTRQPYPDLPNHICALEGIPTPTALLGLLLDLSMPKRKRP